MANRMTERLPDVYRKTEDSNINKLFRLLSDEIKNVNDTLDKTKDWRDVDQMRGETLDRLGEMLGVERQGRDDFLYRRIIKLQIVINQSRGNIETINEVAEVLLDSSYLGLEENWGNEPASFFIVYNYFDLYDSIIQEYQDYVDDPYFLDGEYNLDGERLLNGGISFDLAGALSDILELINGTKHTIELAVAAGVKVYYKIPIDVENDINVEQILDKKLEKQVEEIINIEQELTRLLIKSVEETAINYLDGEVNLDGNRDKVKQQLNLKILTNNVYNFDVEQILDKKLEKQVEEIINIEQTLNKLVEKAVNQKTILRLDGSYKLDGKAQLDSVRDSANQGLLIEVIQ